jgi:hypothetical protein
MHMKNNTIIFDTNAYRNFCSPSFVSPDWTTQSLREAEESRNIVSLANPYVVTELASHLWDQRDPNYSQCRCALTALYEHWREQGGELRSIADSETLVAKMLYNQIPPGYPETAEKLAQLARAVALADGDLDGSVSTLCKALADQVESAESMFVSDMHAAIHRLDPASTGWKPFSGNKAARRKAIEMVRGTEMPLRIAGMLVVKTRLLLGIPIDGPDFDGMSRAVLERLPVPIALYRQILERIVTTGSNISKKERANWIWDMQIAMGIGQSLQNGLPPLTLVTGDKRGELRVRLAQVY